MLKPMCLALALAAAAPAALAQPNDYARLDVAEGRSLAEKLVICDRARLLSNPPDRNADRAYVRVDHERYELALPPDFTRGRGWYDDDLERAYDHLRSRGLIDREEVRAARAVYGDDVPTSSQRPTVSERRFLGQQSRACTALVRDALRR